MKVNKKDHILNWFFNSFSPLDILMIIYVFSVLIWMLFPIKPIAKEHNAFILETLKYFAIYITIVVTYSIYRNSPKIYKFKIIQTAAAITFKMSPFIVGTFIYEKLYYIIPSVINYNFDMELFKIDSFILGDDGSRILEKLLWNTDIIEILAFFYIFYFAVLYIPFIKRFFTRTPVFDLFITGFSLTFLIAFFLNIVFPSLGPKFFFPSDFYQYDLVSGHWMNSCDNMIENLSGGYQAFPSLHFGGPAYILLFDFIHNRRRFWVWLLPIIIVWTSAIFLRYHYVTDHIGGLVIVLFSVWITPKFMSFYTKKADSYREKSGKYFKRSYYFPLDYDRKNKDYHNDKEWL